MKNHESPRSSIIWSKTSYVLLSGFILIIFLIGYVWWPLLDEYLGYFNPDVPIWQQIDWLLIGNFLVMSVLIMTNADLKRDIPLSLIALIGGYYIEAWGTLSELWTYYTYETPPLWIIPAWPIAALSVNRLFVFSKQLTRKIPENWFNWAYWPIYGIFFLLLVDFTSIAFAHPLTWISLLLCTVTILFSSDKRADLLILAAGSSLGYFLERWGTTRLCWVYYSGEKPPFFTVISHGMASVAIWRVYTWYLRLLKHLNLADFKNLIPKDLT